jgi:hypothetical protein
MLLAIAGILLILGLLGFSAFFVAREHLRDLQDGEDFPNARLPRAHQQLPRAH